MRASIFIFVYFSKIHGAVNILTKKEPKGSFLMKLISKDAKD